MQWNDEFLQYLFQQDIFGCIFQYIWLVYFLSAALFGIAAVVTSLIQLSRMSGLKYLKTALNYAGKNSLIFYAMNHVLIYAWTDLFEQGVSVLAKPPLDTQNYGKGY